MCCRRLTRDLDHHDSNEPSGDIRSVDSDSLVVIDPNTSILEQPGESELESTEVW